MNERQFLRKINSRANSFGNFSYDIVRQFLEQNETALSRTNKGTNNFFQLFRKNKNSKEPKQILADNFETILNRTCDEAVAEIVRILLENAGTKNVVLENFEKILERFKHSKNFNDKMMLDILNSQRAKFIKKVSALPEGNSILERNIGSLLAETNVENLFSILESLKGISAEGDNKINEYLGQNRERLIRAMIHKNIRNFSNNCNSLYANIIKNDRRIITK